MLENGLVRVYLYDYYLREHGAGLASVGAYKRELGQWLVWGSILDGITHVLYDTQGATMYDADCDRGFATSRGLG
jgi:hypothetical protein